MKKNTLKELDDVSLWNMMIMGNEQALELLYTKHYNSLYYYGKRFSTDASLVEDCIQDIFVYIYNNRKLETVLQVQSYLLRSLRNLLLKHLSKLHHCSLDEIPFDVSIEDSLFTSMFEKDDVALQAGKDLMKAYQALTENQKNAIYLRYIKELSYHEIADILNINAQSAQNIVSRTLIKLKSMMLLFF